MLGPAGLHLWLHTTGLSLIDSAKDCTKGKSYVQQENNAQKPQAAITNAAIYEPTSSVLCIHPITLPRLVSCAFSFGPPVEHTGTMASNGGNGTDPSLWRSDERKQTIPR